MESCVVATCLKESRSAVRMDIANFTSKTWPQALTYRIWRDHNVSLRDWQVRYKSSFSLFLPFNLQLSSIETTLPTVVTVMHSVVFGVL